MAIRVAYDISALGLGYYNPGNRTGIFRVVENIGERLAVSGELDLTLTATQSLDFWNHALDYLESNPQLSSVSFLQARGLPKDIARALDNVVVRLGRNPNRSLPTRLARTLANRLDKRVNSIWRPLGPEDLSRTDIFHSPFYPLPSFTKQIPHLKRVLTVYDLIPIFYPQFVTHAQNNIIRSILSSLGPDDHILAISQTVKDDVCHYLNIEPSRVSVTYLAADSELFYPCHDPERLADIRRKYSIPDGPYILSVNTVEPRKNMEHAIRSFARLVEEQKVDDLHFVLVGAHGWKSEMLLDEVSGQRAVKDRVILTGYVADEDLAPLYSGALAFVFPSLCEGFGLPPLEAMQCGVPVISSNATSLPEVVGDAGVLVDPLDCDALCQAIFDVVSRPALREELSARSLARAGQFSWGRCARETIAAYKVALEGAT